MRRTRGASGRVRAVWLTGPAVALVAGAGSLAAQVPAAQPELPTVLVLTERVLADLQLFAAGMQNEMILCLGGTVRGDTAVLDRWRMPRLDSSTPVSVRVVDDGCDPRRDLATWHNHPTGRCTQLTALQMGSAVSGNLCYLSAADIRSALERPTAFQILHSGPDRWCWWTLAEVRAFADSGYVVGRPAPGREVSAASPISGALPPEGSARGSQP